MNINPCKTDRPRLYVGFDGELHAFTTGWQGAAAILDGPVPGAISALAASLKKYEVTVVSERMFYDYGTALVWDWLRDQLTAEVGGDPVVVVGLLAHLHLRRPTLRNENLNSGDRLIRSFFWGNE